MQTFLAVIDDLFQFARSAFFGEKRAHLSGLQSDHHIANAMQPKLLSLSADKPAQLGFSSVERVQIGGVVHFIGAAEVSLHTDPVMAFDVVCAKIPYGEQVHLQKLGGRWAFVRWGELHGWILKDALCDQARDVFPSFEEGVMYDAANPETKKVRLCIKDQFCGGLSSLFLTDAEYVTYKLYQKHLFLPWTQQRPRIPGTWQKKLRGQNGVHIAITARTNAVMEYVIDDIGYVAFVEAVFPDDSIKLSSVGLTEEGKYHEEMLSKEQWRELRPVFIQVQ